MWVEHTRIFVNFALIKIFAEMRYSYIKIATAVAVFVCYMIALLTLQDHVIYYQEQHSLFLYTAAYFHDTVHSQGPLGYLGAFMTQFYYYPWLGAFIVSLLACAIYWLTETIIFRITGCRDFLQLGVAAATALYFTLDDIDESPVWILLAAFSLWFIWMLLLICLKPRKNTKYNNLLTLPQFIISVVLAAGYLTGGYFIEAIHINKAERYMIRAERAIKQKNWDEAIDITSRYLATGRTNKLMLYLRSYALAQKGELIDHLFDYPQKAGQQALAFPWTSNSREAEYGHLVHQATGDINAAHEWAFEAMTVWGETAPHLTNLALYNVALGRPKVAEKFARKLDKSLFYKGEAKKIRRMIAGEEPVEIYYAQPDSISTKWINVQDFRPNLMQNYLANPDNEITRQYLIASMLLGNNLKTLIPILKTEDLKHDIIKEAVLIYSLYPTYEPLSDFGLTVDDFTGVKFTDFYKMLKRSPPEIFADKYGKSYWYYKHVINPHDNQ
ncbi:MAG: hypothetical protein J1E78_04730 [Muribaculaceae bacterium]|nr:hypothetical protein [Muribaculaceae bacterium]